MKANMHGMVNQYYSHALSERMKDRCRAALLNGRWPFPAPLGYQNIKALEGHPNIIPDAMAPYVKHAFELVGTGDHRVSEVLRMVTLEGLRSKDGNPLDAHTLWKVLRSKVYCGMVYSTKAGVEPRRGLHATVGE